MSACMIGARWLTRSIWWWRNGCEGLKRTSHNAKDSARRRPQATGVRPSAGAETWGAKRRGNDPERPAMRGLLRPGRPHFEKIASQLADNMKPAHTDPHTCSLSHFLSLRPDRRDALSYFSCGPPLWWFMVQLLTPKYSSH